MRKFAWLGCLMLLAGAPAHAADYPTKPIRLIVGYAAGGSTDVIARLLAAKLGDLIGQQVLVENKPGANSNIAADSVARAAGDGYTLLVGGAAQAINSTLYKNLNFSFEKDFAPVAMVGVTPSVMVVRSALPFKTPQEFIAHAKANPGKINFASSGTGATTHLSGELFKMATGTEMTHVPYRGSAPALNDLLGGQVDVMFDNLISATPFIRSGDLRPLAMTGPTRKASMSEVPTLTELGIDVVVLSWIGIFAPASTPDEITQFLNEKIGQVAEMPDYRKRLEDFGVEPRTMSREELAEYRSAEIKKFARAIEASGARAD